MLQLQNIFKKQFEIYRLNCIQHVRVNSALHHLLKLLLLSLFDFRHVSDDRFPSAAAACRAPSATNQTETSWYWRTSLNGDLLKRLRWLDTRLRHAL